jgi:TatD DNase family protein
VSGLALVDTHAHLDDKAFDEDRDEVIARAKAAGVVAIVTMGVDLASSLEAIALAERYSMVYACVGIHPHFASKWEETTMGELRKMAGHERVVGIGEIGLDYYRNRSPRDAQQRAFCEQIRLARELGLPVVVHDRQADADTLSLLDAESGHPNTGMTGVLHCFSGDQGLAEAAVSRGLFVSIAGPVTYPKSERLSEVVRELPCESMVVETDCPYLTPQQHRGGRNEPAYVSLTVERIAMLRSETVLTVASQTAANAARLFGHVWA